MSGWEKMAETRAKPSMPPPAKAGRFSRLMPPMATQGMDTLPQISHSCSTVMRMAFFLVGEGNTAPTPR